MVLILPMRNGNNIFHKFALSLTKVLILPMRNGNKSNEDNEKIKAASSYPTYEEWKPHTYHSFKELIVKVLILPMRNGNLYYPHLQS